MRSIIATSAARRGVRREPVAARFLDLPGQTLGERLQRSVADLAKPGVTFLRGEVAGPEHRPVLVPVGDEAVDERPSAVESVGPRPRRGEQLAERRGLLPDLVREREHGLLDVTEVLVEGRGRGPDLAAMSTTRRSRSPLLSSNAAVASSSRLRVERPALAERAPVERKRVVRHRPVRSRRTQRGRSPAGTRPVPACRCARPRARRPGSWAMKRAPSSSRSTSATTNGTCSLNGGMPFWRITVNEWTSPRPLAVTHSSASAPQCGQSMRG